MKTNIKSRCYTIVLYPECDKDMNTLSYIKNSFNYAYILHDRDIFLKDVYDKDNKLIHKAGEKKKPHYHVLIYFSNPRSMSKLLDELDVDYIEKANFYMMARYLIHLDNHNKAHYNVSEISSNIMDKVSKCLSREINLNSFDSFILLSYLKEHQYSISFTELTEYAIYNDCLYELKKNSYFYRSFCSF